MDRSLYPTDVDIRIMYENTMNYSKWHNEIPSLKFKSEWDVTICPPVNGAMVRYRIKYGDADISVYLDCHSNLGYFFKDGAEVPYWEFYDGEDCYRYEMNDVEGLMKSINSKIEKFCNIHELENW